MKRRYLMLLVFLPFFLVTFGCWKKEAANSKLETVTVAQWGHTYYLIYLPLYVAQDKGFFEKNGLKVKLKFSGNDDQVFAAVVSGSATFGIGDPVFTAIAKERRDIEGRVIATLVNKVALWGVTNRKDLTEIKSYSQLNGLTVGTFPAPSTTYTIVKDIIQQHRLKTKIREAPIGSQLSLLEAGAADVVMLLEPAASIAELNKGYRVVMSLPKLWGEFAFTGVTTTEKWLRERPETVQKFVNAIEEALNYIYANPEGAKQVAKKYLPKLDDRVIDRAVSRLIQDGVFPHHALVSKVAFERALRIRKEVGDIESIEVGMLCIDNTFAAKAAGKK